MEIPIGQFPFCVPVAAGIVSVFRVKSWQGTKESRRGAFCTLSFFPRWRAFPDVFDSCQMVYEKKPTTKGLGMFPGAASSSGGERESLSTSDKA
jgi:hypothetical protein